MSDHEHGDGASAHLDFHRGALGGWFRYVPLFIFILIIYLLGKSVISNPRAALTLGAYQLSWVEVLLIIATVLSLVEQMKVSHPGIDNTLEALGMVGMGVLQLILFVLGAAKVGVFEKLFNTTEFLVLTFISLAAAVVAVLLNARTLRRTIGVGDN